MYLVSPISRPYSPPQSPFEQNYQLPTVASIAKLASPLKNSGVTPWLPPSPSGKSSHSVSPKKTHGTHRAPLSRIPQPVVSMTPQNLKPHSTPHSSNSITPGSGKNR